MFINGAFIAPVNTINKSAQQKQCKRRLQQTLTQIKGKIICSQVVLKRSKHLKQWRERKLILTENMIGTFKVNGDKMDATEWISLITITSCNHPVAENNDPWNTFVFNIFGEDKMQLKNNFRFACKTKEQRDNWIKLIKSHAKNCPK